MNRIKLNASCMNIITAGTFLGFCSLPLMAETALDAYQCVNPAAITDRLALLNNSAAPDDYRPDPSLYTRTIASSATVIAIEKDYALKDFVPTQGALSMPPYAIKTKTYLRNKPLVLVGTGLDNYALEKLVNELNQQGFVSVKILTGGIAALHKRQDFSSAQSGYFLHRHTAEALIRTATQTPYHRKNFLFVNITGDKNTTHALQQLNLNTLDILHDNEDQRFPLLLQNRVLSAVNEDFTMHVVLIHDDERVYQTLYRSGKLSALKNLWFMQNGAAGLRKRQQQIAHASTAVRKAGVSCLQ